ncbi:uncharacterized protein METZ01_LOCUS441140, partial [marine metagenome]
MKLIVKFSSLFTSLIAIFLVASLENPYYGNIGLPTYHISWIPWEKQVFGHSIKGPQKNESIYEKNLESQITQLV